MRELDRRGNHVYFEWGTGAGNGETSRCPQTQTPLLGGVPLVQECRLFTKSAGARQLLKQADRGPRVYEELFSRAGFLLSFLIGARTG